MAAMLERTPAVSRAFQRLLARAEWVDGCLVVGRDRPTYLTVSVGPKLKVAAHRLSYIAIYGPPPADAPNVLHSCVGRKRCINPLHVRAGTQGENVADAARAGTLSRGERHPNAVLTEANVIAARRARRAGVSLARIAAELGLPKSTVRSAVNGRSWRWLLS
jgi:hypothetical protein